VSVDNAVRQARCRTRQAEQRSIQVQLEKAARFCNRFLPIPDVSLRRTNCREGPIGDINRHAVSRVTGFNDIRYLFVAMIGKPPQSTLTLSNSARHFYRLPFMANKQNALGKSAPD
jgi:hypothetical protein